MRWKCRCTGFFTDESHIQKPNIAKGIIPHRAVNSKQEHVLRAFARLFARMDDKNRELLIHMASRMAHGA